MALRIKKPAQLICVNSAPPIGAASISPRVSWLLPIVVLVGLVCISGIWPAPAIANAALEPMCTGPVQYDINRDCESDIEDLSLIASDWLASDANSTDLNNDDIVNFLDFAEFGLIW